ncbi:MAG: hypothetical protein GXP55_25355, partial [Deltaproteobacteria bacterium]|nr:hypothetical protein [Deltaproteobacteria bacterium]
SYTGNASDDIEVDPFPAIRADTTFPDRGVPYHVMGSGELTVARADTSGAVPTLTLEAGVTITFDSGARLGIGQDTTGHSRPGALVAQGTADAPVTLSSPHLRPLTGRA